MTQKLQWGIVAGIVVLLGGGAFFATRTMEKELAPVSVGTNAPGFSARTVDATPVVKTLSDYRGKVVLLNIWATYCIPCRTEMPSMEALYQALGPEGLAVVAVSIDQSGFEEQIREFGNDYKLTFDVLYDDTGAIQAIYRTTGVPETFIIGRDGVIRKRLIGAEDWNSDENRSMLRQLLAEAPR